MLAVGCCGYQDPDGLERLIGSCWREIDFFIHIDGNFKDYPSTDNWEEHDNNNSKTAELIHEHPNVISIFAPYMLEHQKRQIYLDLCKEYNIEFLIVVDTDEYFYDCKWDELHDELKRVCNDKDHVYNIKSYTEVPGMGLVPIDQPRIIRYPWMVQYLGGHHYQLALKGTDEAITAKNTIYSIKICHDAHLRSPDRKQKHDQYIRWLKRYEAQRMMIETEKEKRNRLSSVWAGA